MRINRLVPPTAAPIRFLDLRNGASGICGRGVESRLKDSIRRFFRVRHAFLVSSGKAAIALILAGLRSMNRKTGVLIPAFTCFSVPSAIRKSGLRIRLCDVDRNTLDYDYERLEASIDDDTLCVVTTHLFGIPVNVDRVKDLCRGRGVFVMEDAAQAMGGERDGRMLGTIGDVGFFSLGRGKNVTCISGGVIVTDSDRIADAIKIEYEKIDRACFSLEAKSLLEACALCIFLRPSRYWVPDGLPFIKLGETLFPKDFPVRQLSRVGAGLMKDWERNLGESNRRRTENAAFYLQELCGEDAQTNGIPYLRVPLLLENQGIRDRIYAAAKREGLGISRIYPTPVNEIEEIHDQFAGQSYPAAKEVSDTLLALPTHEFLMGADRQAVVRIIKENTSSWRIPGKC